MQPHDTQADETTTLATAIVDRLYVLYDLTADLVNAHNGFAVERSEPHLWEAIELCLGDLDILQDDAKAAATLQRENDRLSDENEAYTAAIQEARQLLVEALAIAERQFAASANQALTDLLQSWGIREATGRRPPNGPRGEIAEKSTDDGQKSPE